MRALHVKKRGYCAENGNRVNGAEFVLPLLKKMKVPTRYDQVVYSRGILKDGLHTWTTYKGQAKPFGYW